MAGSPRPQPDLATLVGEAAARAGIRIAPERVPGRGSEAWRHARLRVLEEPGRFAEPPAATAGVSVTAPAAASAPAVAHYVNGRFVSLPPHAPGIATGPAPPAATSDADDAFALLNAAACGEAPRFVIEGPRPLHLTWDTTGSSHFLASARAVVQVPAGGTATLHERFGVATGFLNARLDIVLEPGASLVHCRLGAAQVAAAGLLRLHVHAAEGASYHGICHARGSAFWREEMTVTLAGARGRASLDCVDVAAARDYLERRIDVRHVAADGQSRVRCHAVAAHAAQYVFNGRIFIGGGGRGTDAGLSTRNLLLSNSAEIDAKPELEIYNDAVRCNHGATIGELDADAVFYLRARGIDETAARRLLLDAFLRTPLAAHAAAAMHLLPALAAAAAAVGAAELPP
jgi:Fe-S cluster assembly protein SufD